MPSQELQAALDAAQAAAEVIRRLYRQNLTVTLKADRSPVTQADVQSEEAIRAVLAARFPGYGFYGEETGQDRMQAESRLAGGSDRWHQVVRARLPVLFHADRAHARRPIGVRRVLRPGLRRTGLGRARRRRLAGRQADPRQRRRPRSTAPSCRAAISRRWRVARPGAPTAGWSAASTGFAATATSCTTTCWRAARWTR